MVSTSKPGVAIFDHPTSFRYPTWWHVRDYGLMTANPFGLSHFVDKTADGSYVLAAGGRIRFRYRVLVHAVENNFDFALSQAPPYTRDRCRAGAGAAGHRDARAPLPHAHADFISGEHLRRFDIRALGE